MNKRIKKILKNRPKKDIERNIETALNLAWSYAQIDGDHHKMWVIDQMVRTLCGNEEEYEKWVEAYETPNGSDEHYKWHTGITP